MTSPLSNLFKDRRSIRRYSEQPVPDSLVAQLLEAAVWAPSAHNRQPWRFAVAKSFDTKHKLASAMGARLTEDLTKDGVSAELIAKDVNRSYDRITKAPVLIALCLSMEDMDSYPDAKRSQNEYLMAVQSTAMAGQNMLLAAHALGLGACWMCAPLFVPTLVRDTLGLPKSWQPQALLTLGFPAQTRVKERVSAENRTLYLD